VRYSKLGFRSLVRLYGADLVYTPMIISDCFAKSQHARDADFTTCATDRPLVAQFAASTPSQFAIASEIIAPYVDAVALNCGCPQGWAMSEGYGSALIYKPQLIQDMIRETKARVPDMPIEIKIRLHHRDLQLSVDLARKIEAAGATWLTVHGRTPKERTQPVNYEAIKLIKESVSIPVVANGDIFSVEDAQRVQEMTGAANAL
jgi:tRNA-dihydrouridine synthase 4